MAAVHPFSSKRLATPTTLSYHGSQGRGAVSEMQSKMPPETHYHDNRHGRIVKDHPDSRQQKAHRLWSPKASWETSGQAASLAPPDGQSQCSPCADHLCTWRLLQTTSILQPGQVVQKQLGAEAVSKAFWEKAGYK